MADLIVGLDSWIVQDGNYGDFVQATKVSFALEFCPVITLPGSGPHDRKAPSITHRFDSSYDIVAQVVHAHDDWWVLDAGLLMYCDGKPPDNARLGAWLGGLVFIGVDPFFYFESHAHLPGAPAMVYDWKIEKIEVETGPFIETKPKHFERDPEKRGWKEVARTDAWHDDGGYLLHCTRLDGPRLPKSRSHP
ncbi:hypothetical protein CVM73_36735 [Bradyrhizobium forestalis]|uniref:Uncharacterized protein n=1 Tax=Bradyrhizobium forestalis TaxID=1419263 RepID=A0A2M8QXU7_9BRAD|nr:hypothetical protein [Bradyrhizobium forestalis]PJG50371.1 hypothetical protein CVM73_36735 [Bradyrhizobium forestalis]